VYFVHFVVKNPLPFAPFARNFPIQRFNILRIYQFQKVPKSFAKFSKVLIVPVESTFAQAMMIVAGLSVVPTVA